MIVSICRGNDFMGPPFTPSLLHKRPGASPSCRLLAKLLQWIIALTPGLDPASQWPDSCDAVFFQQKRHPSGGRFIGTGAVPDHVPITRDFHVAFVQPLHPQPQ